MENVLFYFVSALILAFGLIVVTAKNLLHSAMALIATLASTAALYILMKSEFVAISQIMVYIGGIVIFIVFAILLTTQLGEKSFKVSKGVKFAGLIAAFAVFANMAYYFYSHKELLKSTKISDESAGSLAEVGKRLLSVESDGFIVPFEVISILLLVVVVGAITVARKENEETLGEDKR